MNQLKKTYDNLVCSWKQFVLACESFNTIEFKWDIQMLVNPTSYYLSYAVILLKRWYLSVQLK